MTHHNDRLGNPDEWEYDPEYMEAYKQTLAYQAEQLGYAIRDVGHAIEKSLMAMPMLQAFLSSWHADEVDGMPWYRRWWHVLAGHRR